MSLEFRRLEPRVEARAVIAVARPLDLPGHIHPFSYLFRGLAAAFVRKMFQLQPGDFEMYVNPVEERPGDLRQIILYLQWRTMTLPLRVGEVAAWTSLMHTLATSLLCITLK